MAKLVKVIEVLAQSDKSWEDAARQAVGEAFEHAPQHPLGLRKRIRSGSRER